MVLLWVWVGFSGQGGRGVGEGLSSIFPRDL